MEESSKSSFSWCSDGEVIFSKLPECGLFHTQDKIEAKKTVVFPLKCLLYLLIK